MNYDFKANWDIIIMPLLTNPKIKKSIKKGIISYIDDGNCYQNTIYDSNKSPAFYERGDGWSEYIDNYREKLEEKLIETGYLKKDKNEPLTNENDELDDYIETENYNIYENYKEQLMKPFIEYHEKTCIRAYQIFGACHWWNPTFGLTLAKIIYPNEKWTIKKGFYHTTIINKTETLVFDILYFDENDETRGGNFAISEASKKPNNY